MLYNKCQKFMSETPKMYKNVYDLDNYAELVSFFIFMDMTITNFIKGVQDFLNGMI